MGRKNWIEQTEEERKGVLERILEKGEIIRGPRGVTGTNFPEAYVETRKLNLTEKEKTKYLRYVTIVLPKKEGEREPDYTSILEQPIYAEKETGAEQAHEATIRWRRK